MTDCRAKVDSNSWLEVRGCSIFVVAAVPFRPGHGMTGQAKVKTDPTNDHAGCFSVKNTYTVWN